MKIFSWPVRRGVQGDPATGSTDDGRHESATSHELSLPREHFAPPSGFLACTRPAPHDGPCAHPFDFSDQAPFRLTIPLFELDAVPAAKVRAVVDVVRRERISCSCCGSDAAYNTILAAVESLLEGLK